MPDVVCPHCGRPDRIREEAVGTPIVCRGCNRSFKGWPAGEVPSEAITSRDRPPLPEPAMPETPRPASRRFPPRVFPWWTAEAAANGRKGVRLRRWAWGLAALFGVFVLCSGGPTWDVRLLVPMFAAYLVARAIDGATRD
jgi:hypothetical protein